MNTISKTVLILDDEPIFLNWLSDYLESKGYKAKFVTSIGEALDEVISKIYRALVVDLNVPLEEDIKTEVEQLHPVYTSYNGLFVAMKARNSGYRGRQVIVYSVHSNDAVEEECRKLGITYITKGRPHIFKNEIDDVLGYDPTKPKPVA